MTEYNNNMRGVLFRNNRKEKDSQPDHTGSCEIDGIQYWVSAWIDVSKKGNKFFSMSYKRKDAPSQRDPDQRDGVNEENNNGGDDIPF